MQIPIPDKNIFCCSKILFALFLLIFPFMLAAQDEASPLIEKLQMVKGNGKIDLLNQISVVYRKTDRYKSLDFARQAFKLSTENNYLPGKAIAKKNEGIYWFFIGNNDSAMMCYKEALGVFTKIDDEKGISACYNNLGLIAQETGKYDDALDFYKRSIEMDRKLGDEIGVALTMENMADIHIYRGEIRKAFALTNECFKTYRKLGDKPGMMVSYINRGAEYDYLKQYENSVHDYMEALKLARELKDRYREIMVNSNLGTTYWHWKKPEIAMSYLTTALEMSDESDDAYNIDNTLKTIAEIYTSQKEYVKANDIFQKLLNRNIELDNQRQAAVIMTSIGRNLIELNEIDKAQGYLNKSLEITSGLKTRFELLENYRNLAYAYAILHNFKAADSLQDLFANTYSELLGNDSIAGSKKVKQDIGNRNQSTLTDANKWIIALLLFILILMFSVFAFRDEKRR
jgi:tetratricopeptide (TPR) repeat protein